jgi:hypothetical protein
MNRKITTRGGLTLSTGHTIPHGANIGFGHPGQQRSKAPTSVVQQPPLTTFYPWRYSDLRAAGVEGKHQFVTVGENNLMFGNGIHACPGRFFASNEIKVVLVELLRRFDVGLGPGGVGKSEAYPRPKALLIDVAYCPNPMATVWLRDRKVGSAVA